MAAPRQNRRLQKLKKTFAAADFRPRTALGQNFLLDRNQVHYIARTAELDDRDVVLEVGPGSGFLTEELVQQAGRVLAVEVDARLLAVAHEAVAEATNVEFLHADILQSKHVLNPAVEARLADLLAAHGPDARLKCVSNLPYAAGTPFAANLFASDLPWDRAVFLLQKEVADRLVARPGSKAYGALSVRAALGGRVCIERSVPPQVFWPRPKVTSAVVSVTFRPLAERRAVPWGPLRVLTQALFRARRKTAVNALKGIADRDRAAAALDDLGIEPDRRGETIAPEVLVRLAEALADDLAG